MGGGDEKHVYVSNPEYSVYCILKKVSVECGRVLFKGKELNLILQCDVTS